MTGEQQDPKNEGSARSRRLKSLRGVSLGALAVFALALFGSIYLIRSGSVCVIDEISTDGVKGIRACNVAAQVSSLINDNQTDELNAVLGVIAENEKTSGKMLKTLLSSDQDKYVSVLLAANLDPGYLEAKLKKGTFYSTKSTELSSDFEQDIKKFIATGEAENAGTNQPARLLTSAGYFKARDAIRKNALLNDLREKAPRKAGPFKPLGLERLASLPAGQRPGKCEVFVKDEFLNGVWLRIEGLGDGVILRQAVQAIPDEIGGRAVETDIQVNSEDSNTLQLLNLSNRKSKVFVREATTDDLTQIEPACRATGDSNVEPRIGEDGA